MPSLTKKLAVLRPELATFEQLDREMNNRGFIGAKVLAPFQVSVAAGNYGLLTLKSLLAQADADTKRTSTGGYNRGDYELSDRSYQTKENGWEEVVDEREKAMYEHYFQLEEIAAHRAMDTVLLNLEKRVIAATVTALVTAAQTTAAAALWTDLVNARPIDDIEAGQDAVRARTGIYPKCLAISRVAWRKLRRCEQITKEIKAEGAGDPAMVGRISLQAVAEVLDLEEIVVSDSIKNTANRSKPAAIASSWPDDSALLFVRPNNLADFKSRCLGRILHWGGDGSQFDGESLMAAVEMYHNDETRKDVVRARHETDEHILYQQMGQVITGIR